MQVSDDIHTYAVGKVHWDQVVRLKWIAPIGTVELDYKTHGGWTEVALYSAEDIALLPVTRPTVDWRALRTVRPGSRSPLSTLTPTAPGEDWVLLAEAARIAGVGRAAVVNWRRRHADFPDPAGGTTVHPTYDRRAVVAWLLAHDKISTPTALPAATLVVVPSLGAGKEQRFRLDDPWLELSGDAEDEDRLSGWMTGDDADTLAQLTAAETGASIRRLTAPGTDPLAVPDGLQVIDRFRAGSGGLRVTLAWPARLRGTAAQRPAGGVVRHGAPYATPSPACACARQPCGGLIPTPYCPDHGTAVNPVLEWHPAGGIRCTDLTR
ncbi:hypothetical protein [Streptomyces sp. SAJ15]|uniref:hypothetical protein n=1 Tax=Streptomyces sp. SAJ15 TaxID=2011095 RepID=UPI001184E85E|nr:hypothetical protein [Streptomyces sp. SAJ15]TVL88424.1 hypothetical protein CD790_30630 [Streptomyces sp. SAJ15]